MMMFLSGMLAAGAAPAEGEMISPMMTSVSSLLMIIGSFALLYFLMIHPQNKKEKEQKKMRDAIQIGDEVVTIGGIIGIVLRKGDDWLVIETGGERSKIRVKTWAISENMTQHDEQAELGKKKV